MDAPPPPPQISFRPSSSVYDDDDDRWQAQVRTLLEQLDDEVGPVKKVVTPVAGQKGGAVEIILALGSAGVVNAAYLAFKAWLARDKDRSVEITVETPEGKKTIRVTAQNASEAVFKDAVAAAVKKA